MKLRLIRKMKKKKTGMVNEKPRIHVLFQSARIDQVHIRCVKIPQAGKNGIPKSNSEHHTHSHTRLAQTTIIEVGITWRKQRNKGLISDDEKLI